MKKSVAFIIYICISIFILPNVYATEKNEKNLYKNDANKKLEIMDEYDFIWITDDLQVSDFVYCTAIGDSISTGYGLDGYDISNGSTKYKVKSFVNLLGKSLPKQDIVNLSNDSPDIENLLKSLRQLKLGIYEDKIFKKFISQSRIITLTVGEDIILNPIKDAVNLKISNSNGKLNEEEAFKLILKDSQIVSKMISEIETSAKKFTGTKESKYSDGQFMQLISILRSMNSYGDILVQTVYNPYSDIPELSKISDIVENINTTIMYGDKYKVVDTYSIFNQSKTDDILFNPYPTEIGHYLIYRAYLDIL